MKKICEYGCEQEAHYQINNGKWCCSKSYQSCPEIKRKNSEGGKRSYKNGRINPSSSHDAWNKGLTKETDERIRKAAENYKKGIREGRINPPWSGKNIPEDMKIKISKSMKKAHSEGRAWNIGKSRWNNEPSWPEKFIRLLQENPYL